MATKKNKPIHPFNIILIIVCFAIVFVYVFNNNKSSILAEYKSNDVIENYGKDIDLYANIENLPATYFKSLTLLECSGRNDNPHRFEKKVYKQLLEVKKGTRKKYENISQEMLVNIDDEAIKALATSWGPFQIMGYKCIQLKIDITDLHGNDAVFWGIKWINMTYGKALRESRFKDAFHIHNTGKPFPSNNKPFTHDPNYVENGIKYMSLF